MTERSTRRGFTLIELVVVLSIMVILATLGIVGYQSSFPPGVISAARNEIHGMLRFARQQAIVRGTNALLIVNYDKDDPDKFLRYVGVMVEDGIDSGNWLPAHSGVYLPEGIYFVPQSVSPISDGFTFETIWPAQGAVPDMRSEYYCTGSTSGNAIGSIEYPVKQPVVLDASTGNEQDWIGYQFGPDGNVKKANFSICSSASGTLGNQIVLGQARFDQDGNLLFEGSDKTLGIILRINGISFAVDDSNAL